MTDRDFCNELKRYSDRICNTIFHMDMEWIDIEIQINEMRDFCAVHAPEKLNLFEMVYASRFRRLYDTWGYRDAESWNWREESEPAY